MTAKNHCGLLEKDDANSGTFTNFSQNDQALYSLHAYLMYLKFGFGRATQDAGIEIRRKAMTREQALNLVKIYDKMYPSEHIEDYLEYYQMTKEEFDVVIDNGSLDKEIKNLIQFKKALYNSDNIDENQLLNMLKPLINSESIWKSHALYLMAEFFYSKNEKQKSKEFYTQIILLENGNQNLKIEAQKRLNRDLSE